MHKVFWIKDRSLCTYKYWPHESSYPNSYPEGDAMKARSDFLHSQTLKSTLPVRNGENWVLSAYLWDKEEGENPCFLRLDEKNLEISL